MADEKHLSSDIYNVNDFVNAIKKSYTTGVSEDTLLLGTFGYFGQIMSDMFQNSIIMASEFSNESIATKAKFEKNIIAHALGLGITDINAVPAEMEVFLIFLEKDIIQWANAKTADGEEFPWTFVFDKNNKIFFGEYEFHTDYDIVIRKVQVTTKGTKKKFAYTAQYDPDDFAIKNPVSNETNPYLTPPYRLRENGEYVIFTKCKIRQVERETRYTKILADNDISAKTITFTFTGQLASFSLDITEGNNTYHMIPVYEGLNVDTNGQLYFWYTYLNANTIRIKFDRASKIPKINASVQINLQTTQGFKGNFTFKSDVLPHFTFESERLNYSNITCEVNPVSGIASKGSDKKTVEELKRIIPKEALSRGSITNLTDLNNYFNAMNTEYSKLYFYKKRDNCLERLYYSFMIVKDNNNIVPTNTLNLSITSDDLFTEEDSGKLILKQGQIIVLNPESNEAKILKPGEILPDKDNSNYDGSFAYYLPYNFIINKSPLYGMYILTTIHDRKNLEFVYINEDCLYQYICTYIDWDRNCIEDHNTYKLTVDVSQNIIYDPEDQTRAPIYYDENGNMVCDVDVYMIVYNEKGSPLRWAKAKQSGFRSEEALIVTFEFKFTTRDYIDKDNRIRIDTGFYDIGTNYESYAHLNSNMKTRLFIVSKQDVNYGFNNSEYDISNIIPGLDGMSLSNAYEVIGGINYFYDYSAIVNSTVTVTDGFVVAPLEDPNPSIPVEDDGTDRLSKEQLKADIDFLYALTDPNVDSYKMGLLYHSKYWDTDRIQALRSANKLTTEQVEDVLENAVNIPRDPVDDDPTDNPKDPDSSDYYPPGFDSDDPSSSDEEKDKAFTEDIKKSITEKIPNYLEEILIQMDNSKKGSMNEVQSSEYDSSIIINDDNSSGSISEASEIEITDIISDNKNQILSDNINNLSQTSENNTLDSTKLRSTAILDDTNIYYSSFKARSDVDFIYALQVTCLDIDVYELAYKYYPIYWNADKINALADASRLTRNQAASLLGYTGDGSDRPAPEIKNSSAKEIRSDIDFLYALGIVQDSNSDAYELAKLHRPYEWDDKRIEALYFARRINKNQTVYLLGYAPPMPGTNEQRYVPEPRYRQALTYHITGIPVVKYDYFVDEDTAKRFFNELVSRKYYIEDAIKKLEDAFEMDFKFFNTYGPSKFFTWDNNIELLDKVNISLFFKLKLKPNYDTNIVEDIRKDVKNYVEDINKIDDLHIPNLITKITNTYKDSIVYFEFVSINGKTADYQHIYSMPVPDGIMVPEFININTLSDGIPDITIELV